MQGLLGFLALAFLLPACGSVVDDARDAHHPHRGDPHGRHNKHVHHSHHHGRRHDQPRQEKKVIKAPVAAVEASAAAVKPSAVVKAPVAAVAAEATHTHAGSDIVDKMKKIEARLAEQAKAQKAAVAKGHLLVNGPLPVDFNERFAQAVGQATSVDARKVQVTDTVPLEDNKNVIEVAFVAPPKVVKAVENEAADPESTLAKGNMRPYLVAKDDDQTVPDATSFTVHKAQRVEAPAPAPEPRATEHHAEEVTPVQEKGIDIDTQMPYGDLEPFGREDTAQELTESSVKESDEMVDQLERAEVAEEKRAVFRALTRLRGAAITSFDGVARSQTGNIDEYNKVHKWRKTHPLHHLANEESDVTKWAFPDNADF